MLSSKAFRNQGILLAAWLLIPACVLSQTLKLQELPDNYIHPMSIVSSQNGYSIAIWKDFLREQLLARIRTPDGIWGEATLLAQGRPLLGKGVIRNDGFAIAMWTEQESFDPNGGKCSWASKSFTPSRGWDNNKAVLSDASVCQQPALALTEDGYVHFIFGRNESMLAMTLAPGDSVWSSPVSLGAIRPYDRSPAELIAWNGHALLHS
jgi:hypothetical protein